jgi:CRP/FNR family transcriptional regulator
VGQCPADERTALLRLVAQRQRRTDGLLADVVDVDAYGRLARQMLQLADRFGSKVDGCIRVQHDLSHDELAQLTGISRGTMNRALSELAERGWVWVEPGSVTICQPESFAQRARWRR